MTDDPKAVDRKRVLDELYKTEKVFSRDLALLIKFYVEPLQDKKIIESETHYKIFSNVVQIASISESVTKLFDEHYLVEGEGIIASVFSLIAPNMSSFKIYCVRKIHANKTIQILTYLKKVNYPLACHTLEDMRNTNKKWLTFERVKLFSFNFENTLNCNNFFPFK